MSVSVLVIVAAYATALERFQLISDWGATEALGDATVEIIDKYFVSQVKVVNIFAATVEKENKYSEKEVMSYVLKKLGGTIPYQIHVISNGTPKKPIENEGGFKLFFVDGFESLR